MSYNENEKVYEGEIIQPDRLKIPYGELYPFYFEDVGYRLAYLSGIPIGEKGNKIREIQKKFKTINDKDIEKVQQTSHELLSEILKINYSEITTANIMKQAIISYNDFIYISGYLNGLPFPFYVKVTKRI